MTKLKSLGMTTAQARHGARELSDAGASELDVIDHALGELPPSRLVANGVDVDIVSDLLDRRAAAQGITDPAERVGYVVSAFGDGTVPPNIRLQRSLNQIEQRHPGIDSRTGVNEHGLRIFRQGTLAQRETVIQTVEAYARLLDNPNYRLRTFFPVGSSVFNTHSMLYPPGMPPRLATPLERIVGLIDEFDHGLSEADFAAATGTTIDEVRAAIDLRLAMGGKSR